MFMHFITDMTEKKCKIFTVYKGKHKLQVVLFLKYRVITTGSENLFPHTKKYKT
jgi:hypothetical protein